MKARVDPHAKVAIFAVDGGTTSGVARGIFPRYSESAWQGLTEGWHESWDVEGEPAKQAWEIIGEYADWIDFQHGNARMNELGVVLYVLIFEDFVIRLGPGASSKRELLDPVRVH